MDTKKFVELVEDAGYTVRDYSGRGMYGKVCVAVEPDDNNECALVANVMLVCAENITDGNTDEINELASIFKNTKTDSMGIGIVVYWPSMELEE